MQTMTTMARGRKFRRFSAICSRKKPTSKPLLTRHELGLRRPPMEWSSTCARGMAPHTLVSVLCFGSFLAVDEAFDDLPCLRLLRGAFLRLLRATTLDCLRMLRGAVWHR